MASQSGSSSPLVDACQGPPGPGSSRNVTLPVPQIPASAPLGMPASEASEPAGASTLASRAPASGALASASASAVVTSPGDASVAAPRPLTPHPKPAVIATRPNRTQKETPIVVKDAPRASPSPGRN